MRLVIALVNVFVIVSAIKSREVTNADNNDGPLKLAEVVKNVLLFLSEARSGDEATAALEDLVDRANALLTIYGGETSQQTTEADSNDNPLQTAITLDAEFFLLSQYADTLFKMHGSGNNISIKEAIEGIKRTASAIIRQIDDQDIEVIAYQVPKGDETDLARDTRGICFGIYVWGKCYGYEP